jgi:hypothetical protein
MAAELKSERRKNHLLRLSRNRDWNEGEILSGHFNLRNERLRVAGPPELRGTAIEYWIVVHELAHFLQYAQLEEAGATDIWLYTPSTDLELAELILYREDYTYRWEHHFLSALKDEEIVHLLQQLKTISITPNRIHNTLYRILANRKLPLKEYVSTEWKHKRHDPRGVVEFRAACRAGSYLLYGLGTAILSGCVASILLSQ